MPALPQSTRQRRRTDVPGHKWGPWHNLYYHQQQVNWKIGTSFFGTSWTPALFLGTVTQLPSTRRRKASVTIWRSESPASGAQLVLSKASAVYIERTTTKKKTTRKETTNTRSDMTSPPEEDYQQNGIITFWVPDKESLPKNHLYYLLYKALLRDSDYFLCFRILTEIICFIFFPLIYSRSGTLY